MSISSEFTKNTSNQLKQIASTATPSHTIIKIGITPSVVGTDTYTQVLFSDIRASDIVFVSSLYPATVAANGFVTNVVISAGVGFEIDTLGASIPAAFEYSIIRENL
jgi:hypothetical protein